MLNPAWGGERRECSRWQTSMAAAARLWTAVRTPHKPSSCSLPPSLKRGSSHRAPARPPAPTWRSTSSASRKASCSGVDSPTTSSSRSLGITISVSTFLRSVSTPSAACAEGAQHTARAKASAAGPLEAGRRPGAIPPQCLHGCSGATGNVRCGGSGRVAQEQRPAWQAPHCAPEAPRAHLVGSPPPLKGEGVGDHAHGEDAHVLRSAHSVSWPIYLEETHSLLAAACSRASRQQGSPSGQCAMHCRAWQRVQLLCMAAERGCWVVHCYLGDASHHGRCAGARAAAHAGRDEDLGRGRGRSRGAGAICVCACALDSWHRCRNR